MPTRPRPDRIGPGDLMQLVSDVGPAPANVGAVLVLDVPPDAAAGTLAPALLAEIGRRLGSIPRLRQRLVRLPWGLGRPIWVEQAEFDPAAHVRQVRCAAPGDRQALLDTAVGEVLTPLPAAMPLWRASLVTDLSLGRMAVVLVLHHVLADGVGALTVLGCLSDAGAGATQAALARPSGTPAGRPAATTTAGIPPGLPTRHELLADALTSRARSVSRAPRAAARLWAARRELDLGRGPSAARCSLNMPTGPRRQAGIVTASLSEVREVAQRHSATVNDVLLTVVAGTLLARLRDRGEAPAELVVSVPVSARAPELGAELGNRVGVMPVAVPLVEPAELRLDRVAATTRTQRTAVPGASEALVGPLFRTLAAVRLLRRFVNHQRLVNTFLSNLRGPGEHLALAGVDVLELIPVVLTTGNITVGFAALSYAGTLAVAVLVDPDLVENPSGLTDAVRAELAALGIPASTGER